MRIADNIIKQHIQNVFFIWGRGKTTIANALRDQYGCFVYSVDDSRARHRKDADPLYQPTMCRNYVQEYGVSDFWQLPPEVIEDRETKWLIEFTPMAILDLILLAPQHEIILCEGDIDDGMVLPIASRIVYLANRGTKFDWFNRPDHSDALDCIKNRLDLTQAEKDELIRNAYNSVGHDERRPLPDWGTRPNIKNIIWDDNTSIEQTAQEVAQFFGL